MPMIVQKTARKKENCFEPILFFESARAAFKELLDRMLIEETTLLLPAYIGWSSNEGSGIYDPVVESNIKHEFYLLDENLNINVENLQTKLDEISGKKALLLVHYFGYVDPAYQNICHMALEKDCYIIEDCAHALYTDYVDGQCGHYADAVFYSLHKMLPLKNGGMMKIKNHSLHVKEGVYNQVSPFCYDFKQIADIRKKNAKVLEDRLSKLEKYITILRPEEKYPGQTPQTFPIRFKEVDKSAFYFELNDMKFGVVSLYHTMIEPLRNKKYQQSMDIGNTILNLPVHQDATPEQMQLLCDNLEALLNGKIRNL